MTPGLFTQGAAVLFDATPSLDVLAKALGAFTIVKAAEPSDHPWMGGPGFVIAMRPEVNGHVVVDLIDKPWPDHMGDPQREPALFAVWSMGWFGPYVFPGALERAVLQAHHLDKAVASPARAHRAFVRIKSTYALGAGEDVPLAPPDHAPLDDLRFVTRVARALLDVPGASHYFNSGGEMLHTTASLERALAHEQQGLVPLPAWSNVRMWKPEEARGWFLMDTVGMEQLGGSEHEACVPPDGIELGEVAGFLRNAALYTLEKGPVIEEGNTIDGPGGVWKAHLDEESLSPPPRPVLRWRPVDAEPPPPCFRFPVEGKRRGWKLWKGGG